MTSRAVLPLRPPASRRVRSFLVVLLTAAGLCCVQPPLAGAQSSLIIVPRPSTQTGLSYFKLAFEPGEYARAGAIELRNPSSRQLRVALAAVDGQTLSTLGSGYASPGSVPLRSTRWLRVDRRLVVLGPRQRTVVNVSVGVPRNAAPGDYLSGVSVEALDQNSQSTPGRGISIASVDRYVIGVEVSISGPRHPLIRFTGAELQRQPAGLTFLLLARNPGNVILQGTNGRAWITQGQRTVAAVPLGPGTFVTGTSIAYPIPTPRERPREGTVYRVRAYLKYAGGIAWLDTLVRFGHAAALTQQLYGGPRAHGASGLSAWLVALLALGAGLLVLLLVVLWRRRRDGVRSPIRTVEGALRASRQSGEPLSLIAVAPGTVEGPAAPRLAPVLRSRLRHADRLCRLKGGAFMIVAPDTDADTAEALAADLRRHVERVDYGAREVAIEVHVPEGDASAAELLQQVTESIGGAHVLTPSG